MPATLTIDDLAADAAAALDRLGVRPANGQIAAAPDKRMLRYYASIGLLDRPSEVRGRTALYGRRHLLQVVATKRLQAEGLTLADVQARLAGVEDAELEGIAALDTPPSAPPAPTPRASRPAFWEAAPAPAAAPPPHRPSAPPVDPAAVRLAPGVTLVVDAARSLTPDDRAAIATAVALDLLPTLIERGLVQPENGATA